MEFLFTQLISARVHPYGWFTLATAAISITTGFWAILLLPSDGARLTKHHRGPTMQIPLLKLDPVYRIQETVHDKIFDKTRHDLYYQILIPTKWI